MSINGAQSGRLEKGTIEFKSYFKQIPVPFKIYANFECNLKSVESFEGSYSKKYQDHIPCSFGYKLVCVNDKFTKPIDLLHNDSKYLVEEFGSKNLGLLKQKDAYPYEYMDSFKRFSEERLPDKQCFYSSVKDGTTGDNDKN